MSDKKEKPDHHMYSWLTFYPEAMKFYLASLRYYQRRLEDEMGNIQEDDLFKELFTNEVFNTFPIAREAMRFQRIADRFVQIIEDNPDAWDYELSLSHGDIRILKSVGQLYLRNLQQRRNNIAAQASLSRMALEALDTKLAEYQEKLEQGVFSDASIVPLLVDEPEISETIPKSEKQAVFKSPPPKILASIELLDPQLRERCLDLFYDFDNEGKYHRFDTIISEATRILEDRIRHLSGADRSLSGVDLMTFAFSPSNPRLILSDENSEQEAAHLLFRGLFGFIRNPFHHRIIEDLQRERVLQLLGLIDYLLFLSESAKRPQENQDIHD